MGGIQIGARRKSVWETRRTAYGVQYPSRLSAEEGASVHGVLRTTRDLEREPAGSFSSSTRLAVAWRDGAPKQDRLGLGIERSAGQHISINRHLDPSVLGPRRDGADQGSRLEAQNDARDGSRGGGVEEGGEQEGRDRGTQADDGLAVRHHATQVRNNARPKQYANASTSPSTIPRHTARPYGSKGLRNTASTCLVRRASGTVSP